jgi:hypothetical protein
MTLCQWQHSPGSRSEIMHLCCLLVHFYTSPTYSDFVTFSYNPTILLVPERPCPDQDSLAKADVTAPTASPYVRTWYCVTNCSRNTAYISITLVLILASWTCQTKIKSQQIIPQRFQCRPLTSFGTTTKS